MKTLDASTIAQACGGEIVAGSGSVEASWISTDTRSLPVNSLFCALKGERFDANDFTAQAISGGASVLMVERWEGPAPGDVAIVRVKDTLIGLQRLARWYRMQRDIPVVGITGSNGKTSTKDFTAAVLRRGFKVRATKGNLNNHIGVPLTVLSIEEGDSAAVVEMGMNHPGEIAPLCEIARPTLGIITNIGSAHIEHLGTREAIAEEKGALARSLGEDGALFVPAGSDFYDYFKSRTKARVIPVGNGRGLVRAENVRETDGRSTFTLVIEAEPVAEVEIPVLGRHMIKNSLLAAGCGWFLGLHPDEIAAGLSSTVMTSGRMRRYLSNGVTVYDDTYNANPESMAAAIEVLADTPLKNGGRHYAVLGPMGELGSHAPEAHLRVGRLACERGLIVIAVGEGAEGIARGAGGEKSALYFPDRAVAVAELSGRVKPGDAVLFKASRSAAIERLMNEAFPPND